MFTARYVPNLCIKQIRLVLKRVNISGHGSGSSVSIVTDYGLDGPGSNTGGDEIFHPSRPALGPT